MTVFVFELFVAGSSPRSRRAETALRTICESRLGDRYQLSVVDVLEHPQRAEDDKILATPTLIKRSPRPPLRIIGDLSQTDAVIERLGLASHPPRAKASEIVETASSGGRE